MARVAPRRDGRGFDPVSPADGERAVIPPRPRDAVELTPRDVRVLGAPAPDVARGLDVLVAVAVSGTGRNLERCLDSVCEQTLDARRVGVVVLVDAVPHADRVPDLPPTLATRAWSLAANCGSAARARNTLLGFIEANCPSARWIARLDWDDRFAAPDSLRAAVELGESRGAKWVLGGNRVLDGTGRLLRTNPADHGLLAEDAVRMALRGMSDGTASNELPSCNLVVSARAGLRYVDTASAEDHWLVARLLLLAPETGAILREPYFVDYTLDGGVTQRHKESGAHRRSREALRSAAETWLSVRRGPGAVLGLGQEGIVLRSGDHVLKVFYPGVLSDEKVEWLERRLGECGGLAPPARFARRAATRSWEASYPLEPTSAAVPCRRAAADFLAGCVRHGLTFGDIKRSNFRVRADGSLLFVDIGNWIGPMDVSVLRDSAARLYAQSALGWADDELLRRPADHSRPAIWDRLDGFSDFYREVVGGELSARWSTWRPPDVPAPTRRSDTTLLIKACAMDASTIRSQVEHLVGQLCDPEDFAERILLVDGHEGPFARAHSPGDLPRLLAEAEVLRASGRVDRVLLARPSEDEIRRLNHDWFGLDASVSRSEDEIPVAAHLWGLEQVRTRFVLQCDADVLVGRADPSHRYLAEMLDACRADGVLGVAFNIPHAPGSPHAAYGAPAGEYKPEVRCGLLDLDRVRACRPIPNQIVNGRLAHTWYRSLHAHQRRSGTRTLRGGSPATFYVHPPNHRKSSSAELARIRDTLSRGTTPPVQWERWDLDGTLSDWRYPERREDVVILARGRDTPPDRVARFACGLGMQCEQSFGVVAIDDASSPDHTRVLERELRWLGSRLTLVRRAEPAGRMANNVFALREICTNPASMVVVVDMDDALAHVEALSRLVALARTGHDLVLAAPFRPDAPLKVYRPAFRQARQQYGGDVWIHLRAFRRSLFDAVPDEMLQVDGRWLERCDDYAIMVPLSEIADRPVYVPEYWYWHERTTRIEGPEAATRERLIEHLMALPSLCRR